jgi:CCR4-NOT transcription complex subunit 9
MSARRAQNSPDTSLPQGSRGGTRVKSPSTVSTPPAASAAAAPPAFTTDHLVLQIKRIHKSESERADAVQILWDNHATLPDLAIALWFSPATMTSLLTDVLGFFPQLVSAKIIHPKSDTVHLILHLFKLIAAHDDTRLPFIRANLLVYLFPILKFTLMDPEAERFVGVIIAILTYLVKQSEQDAIVAVIRADFVPLCLRVLQHKKAEIRAGAAYVLAKVFSVEDGHVFLGSVRPDEIKFVLAVYNQVLRDLSQAFDAQLSKWFVVGYQQLLTVPKVVQFVTADFDKLEMKGTDDGFRAFVEQLRKTAKR